MGVSSVAWARACSLQRSASFAYRLLCHHQYPSPQSELQSRDPALAAKVAPEIRDEIKARMKELEAVNARLQG